MRFFVRKRSFYENEIFPQDLAIGSSLIGICTVVTEMAISARSMGSTVPSHLPRCRPGAVAVLLSRGLCIIYLFADIAA